jgi:hypothetical protein
MNLQFNKTGNSPVQATALSKSGEYVSLDFLSKHFSISRRTLETWSPNIVGRTKLGRLVRFHLPTIEKEILAGRDPFSPRKKQGVRK